MSSRNESAKRILVIDDDRAVLQSCLNILSDEGYDVETAASGQDGVEALRHGAFDLALVDLKMPGLSGLEVLKAIRRFDSELVVIIFTAYATIETAVEAIRLGAFDYVTKPFTASELVGTVEKGLQRAALNRPVPPVRGKSSGSPEGNMLWRSSVMEGVANTLRKVAASESNVLITGESGTGKEVAAHWIHLHSRRAGDPFIAVDCAAIPDNLLESELFGYEKGAFTGADHRKRGLLELADNGTLLLDEIGEMSLALQSRLLRTMQERSFRRLGGEQLISVNIRLISSTNRDLEAAAAQGQFRGDLLYRLNVVMVLMPPLRRREGDLELLSRHFLDLHAVRVGRGHVGISPEAAAAMHRYEWPGNVRELENVMERAVVLNEDGVIGIADLPDHIVDVADAREPRGGAASYHDARALWIEDQGRQYFSDLLARHKGNISGAAREARISRKSFYHLLRKLDLESHRR